MGSGATTFAGTVGWELLRAGAHGAAQGGLSVLQGGSFGSGFLSGALGSLAGSAFGSVGGDFAKSFWGVTTFSALAGGVGSKLGGGSFWQGTLTGATIGALNHGMHRIADGMFEDEQTKQNQAPKSKMQENTEKASKILGATSIATETKMAIIGDKMNFNNFGRGYTKLFKMVGPIANGVDAFSTITDGYGSWQPSHTADLTIQGAILGLNVVPIIGPGLSISTGAAYYLYNSYFQNTHNGLSPTQYYLNR